MTQKVRTLSLMQDAGSIHLAKAVPASDPGESSLQLLPPHPDRLTFGLGSLLWSVIPVHSRVSQCSLLPFFFASACCRHWSRGLQKY